MIGLAVLAVVAAYVAVFGFVIAKGRNRPEKISAIAIALLIPFWDWPIGYYKYHVYCRDDGGIKRFEAFPPQKSLYFTYFAGYRPERLIKAGLETVEYRKPDGSGVIRFSQSTNGTIQSIESKSPASTARVRLVPDERLAWDIRRQEQVLEDSRTDKPLVRATRFSWSGGWISQAAHFSPVATCHDSSLNRVIDLALKGSSS